MPRRAWWMLALVVACQGSKPEPARHEAAARAVRQMQAMAAELAPAVKALEAPASACASLGEARPYALVDAGYFEQFEGGTFRPASPREVWFRAEEFVAMGKGLSASPRDDEAVSKAFAGIVARGGGKGVVVALHAVEQRLPAMNEAAGPENAAMIPGRFEGWALLLDPRAGKLLCRTKLSAASSKDLSFREGEEPKRVAFADFQRALSRAVEEAFEARGPKLQRYRW